jgi:hypothetical protein
MTTDDISTIIMEEWAQSIRWLQRHRDALRGKRALATFVKEVASAAEAEAHEVMFIKSGNREQPKK